MSNYSRVLCSGMAKLVDSRSEKTIATFFVGDFNNNWDNMREACNSKWDELDKNDKNEKNKEKEMELNYSH